MNPAYYVAESIVAVAICGSAWMLWGGYHMENTFDQIAIGLTGLIGLAIGLGMACHLYL